MVVELVLLNGYAVVKFDGKLPFLTTLLDVEMASLLFEHLLSTTLPLDLFLLVKSPIF